jgi:transposase
MHNQLFESALGIGTPWPVNSVESDLPAKRLVVLIDFTPGTRFALPGHEGLHPVYDTITKEYRHLNFFEHQCHLRVRTPRVRLPDGTVRLVEPEFAGRLSGFTLLYEALLLMLAQQMPFAAAARLTGESPHRVLAVCRRYVELALEKADYSTVRALAIDETSRARGHDYITLAADAQQRKVLFVTEGRNAETIRALAEDLQAHGCPPEAIASVSIDRSPAFIKGVDEHLPNARVTFDKFHVIAHANKAVDQTRRSEHRTEPTLKGLRWTLLKDVFKLDTKAWSALHDLITAPKLTRTARAWVYKEQLREISIGDRSMSCASPFAIGALASCALRSSP